MVPREVDKHSVARVYYADSERPAGVRSWVRCRRLEGSVSVDRCASCAHLVRVASDSLARASSVYCYDAQADGTSEAEQRALRLPPVPISDLMARNVLCVRPNLPLDALVMLFAETGLKAVPVVDHEGTLLGVASVADALLEMQARPTVDDRTGPVDGSVNNQPVANLRDAESVMRPFPLALAENVAVSRAAAAMVYEEASEAVVVSAQGDIVGVLSMADILFWLARADGYLLDTAGREPR